MNVLRHTVSSSFRVVVLFKSIIIIIHWTNYNAVHQWVGYSGPVGYVKLQWTDWFTLGVYLHLQHIYSGFHWLHCEPSCMCRLAKEHPYIK